MTVRTRAYFAGLSTLDQADMGDLFDTVLMDQDISTYGRALVAVADAAAGRTSLGLGDVATLAKDTDTTLAADSDARVATQKAVKAHVAAAIAAGPTVPTGAVVMWMLNTVPTGWLACEGANVSRSTYAALFAVLGTTYGSGDGSTTFGLPDFSSKFPRGAADPTTSPTGGADTHDHAGATGSEVTGITGGVVNNANRGVTGANNTCSAQSVNINDPGHTHTIPSADNVPAYRKARFIIKT